MKKLSLPTILLMAFVAVQSARAVTISQITPNSIGPAGPALTFTGFPDGPQAAVAIPGGSLSYNGAVIVQAINDGNGAPPYPVSQGDYLSVMAGGVATFSYSSPASSFGFMWGSIDTYNTIEFFLGGVSQGSFGGSTVASPANGFQGFGGSAYVSFAGAFDSVVLTSSTNSFEVDNVSVSVPDGGMTIALFGLSLLGMTSMRRWFKQTARKD